MAIVLGISAYFHDSSACIVVDGSLCAAVCEERFTRKKHDASLPENAIRYCLEAAQCSMEDVDAVVFHEKPFTKFERILDTLLKRAPAGFRPFSKALDNWLREKFWVEDAFRRKFPFKGTFNFAQHHLSHAATAAYSSGFDTAAIVIIDGVGERACTTIGRFENGRISLLKEQRFPHSIGLLYSAFTQYCGFKVNSGEYKLMGLASYGEPRFCDLIYQHLVVQNLDGTIQLNLKHFAFLDDLKMIRSSFGEVLGRAPRAENDPMSPFYMDMAASIQKVCEELVMCVLRHAHGITGATKLIYGGGVALNCVANARILAETSFDEVFIHSASGDSGCAMGAALWHAASLEDVKSSENSEFLGPAFDVHTIREALNAAELKAQEIADLELFPRVAELLSKGAVTGWFQGRMEFGPRALGNRSILANPAIKDMKTTLNRKIKKREGFRPFAPVILDAEFERFFVDQGNDYSRMLYVTPATAEAQIIPSCIHEDNSARVQRLKEEFNPRLHALLNEFRYQTGLPVLINTSFNERGEPMVNTPEDAIHCFLNTEMDVLVMGNFLVLKEDNRQVQFIPRTYAMD